MEKGLKRSILGDVISSLRMGYSSCPPSSKMFGSYFPLYNTTANVYSRKDQAKLIPLHLVSQYHHAFLPKDTDSISLYNAVLSLHFSRYPTSNYLLSIFNGPEIIRIRASRRRPIGPFQSHRMVRSNHVRPGSPHPHLIHSSLIHIIIDLTLRFS